MSNSLQTTAAMYNKTAAARIPLESNGLTSGSPMTSLPPEVLLNITSRLSVAQFLRFRGVCRHFHQVSLASERGIVRQLLRSSELRQIGKLFGNTGPELETYKHLFGLIRRRSIVNTLANFMLSYDLEIYPINDRPKLNIRSYLLLLTHFLEHYFSSLSAFVSDPNNKSCLWVENLNIRALIAAKYDRHVVEMMDEVHFWLTILLNDRLKNRSLNLFDEGDVARVPYSELAVFGGIEAIKDCLLPDTLDDRIMQMQTHMAYAGSNLPVDHKEHRLSELPARTADVALSLNPITPLLHRQTAACISGILPEDKDILENLPDGRMDAGAGEFSSFRIEENYYS